MNNTDLYAEKFDPATDPYYTLGILASQAGMLIHDLQTEGGLLSVFGNVRVMDVCVGAELDKHFPVAGGIRCGHITDTTIVLWTDKELPGVVVEEIRRQFGTNYGWVKVEILNEFMEPLK